MRMNERSRDWLDLSAYIDGELGPREKEKFERRLQSDPQLRSELNQLKVTRSMIRSLPRRKVPRNFTLTPDMLPAPRKSLWLPVFSYASAASAVIVLVLLLVQFLPGGFLGKGAPAENQLAMSAEMDGYMETASEQPQIIYWGGVAPQVMAEGKGGGGPQSAPVYTQDNANTLMLPPDQTVTGEQETLSGESAPETAADGAPEEMPADPLQAQATPTAERDLASPQSTEALRQQESTAAEEAAPQAEGEPVTQAYGGETQFNGPILGVKPDDQANQMTIPESYMQPGQQSTTGEIPLWVTYLFSALAVVTAAAAIYLWRRSH